MDNNDFEMNMFVPDFAHFDVWKLEDGYGVAVALFKEEKGKPKSCVVIPVGTIQPTPEDSLIWIEETGVNLFPTARIDNTVQLLVDGEEVKGWEIETGDEDEE